LEHKLSQIPFHPSVRLKKLTDVTTIIMIAGSHDSLRPPSLFIFQCMQVHAKTLEQERKKSCGREIEIIKWSMTSISSDISNQFLLKL